MSEQFCVDWINSLDIPGSAFIDKIEDLFNNNNILLNIISIILNKKEEEIIYILGDSKSFNYLENISNLMNLYFDYNFDYKNKESLIQNTILLLKFLKSRYPKVPIKNINYEINHNIQKFNKKELNYPNGNNNNYDFIKDDDNFNQESNNKVPVNNNNNKINKKAKIIKSKKEIGKFEPKSLTINDYPIYNIKSVPIRSISSDKIRKNKIYNTSSSIISNNNILNNNNKKKDSFYKEISIITNNLKRNSKVKSEYLSPILKSEDFKNSKSLSSDNLSKAKRKIKEKNSSITSENFIKKVMTSKIPNYFLMTRGNPILKKDDFFYYYQFPKLSFPVTHINIEESDKFNKNTNKNTYYKFPFLLQNLMNHKNIKKYKENNNNKNYKIVNNINENEKKEKLILDYLNKLGIINPEQKNKDYLWKILIPDLKDGYIIGKLINLLEKKNRNYLKGISKETFYKVNIYFNWQKIIEFLINRNRFNSIYLYQKNFYSNDKKLFNFLYDLINFYYEKENINKKFREMNQKYDCNISNIKNISNHNLVENNINFTNNFSYLNKSSQNKSYNSTPIPPKNRKKQINIQNGNLQMNSTPSISEIMNIRKSLNYVHRENNSFVFFKDKKNLNKSEEFINLSKNNQKEKIYIKGENLSFDKNVDNILSFLKLIGLNTTQINFYTSEMKIFKDGILLYQIISQLENNLSILPKIDLNPKSPSNAINNHRLIINFLNKYKKNFPVELTEKEKELYKAKPKFILKFLNTLKSIYNNEIFYLEKISKKNKYIKNKSRTVRKNSKINPKNIDKSERLTIPLNQELRNKFLIKENAQIWA